MSYEAARRYHYSREPPIRYLVRVSEVFGYRLEWLATGEGAPTELEETAHDAESAMRMAFNDTVLISAPWSNSTAVEDAAAECLRRLIVALPEAKEVSMEQMRGIAGRIEQWVLQTLETFGAFEQREMSPAHPSRKWDNRLLALLQGLRAVIPDRQRGRPLDGLLDDAD